MAPRRKSITEGDDFSSSQGDYSAPARKRLRSYVEEEEKAENEEHPKEEDPEEHPGEEEDPEELPEEEDPEELPEEEDPEELPEEEEAIVAEKGYPEEEESPEEFTVEEEEERQPEELLFEEAEKEFAQEEEPEEEEEIEEQGREEELFEEETVNKKESQGHQYQLNSEAEEIRQSSGSVEGIEWSRRARYRRLWSEGDEITILKGMIEFRRTRGICACADLRGFYDFIKDYLQFDASEKQLIGKVKRFERKYLGNKLKTTNMKDGEARLLFTTVHEERVFLLSRNIWGKEDNHGNNTGGGAKTVNSHTRATNHHDGKYAEEEKEMGAEEQEFWSVYPRLHESLKVEQFSGYTLPVCGARLVKQSLSSIGRSKAKELEDKWTMLHKAELDVKLMRALLIQEQTQVILDVL